MNPRNRLTLCQNLSKIGPVVFEILRFENWFLGPRMSMLWSQPKRVLPESYIRSCTRATLRYLRSDCVESTVGDY